MGIRGCQPQSSGTLSMENLPEIGPNSQPMLSRLEILSSQGNWQLAISLTN